MRHGTGKAVIKMTYGDRVYEGEWRRSMRDGTGTEVWPNGDVYKGEWAVDKFDGLGVLTSGTCKYAGAFKNGLKEGYGACVFSNGCFYEGSFSNNRMHGWGEYIYADDSRYEGNWKDGLKDGIGVFTTTVGEKHDGHWEKGKRHGDGVFRWNNGKTRQGVWKRDCLMKWTNKESFGVSIHYHRGRPSELNRLGNIDIIRHLREVALFRAASQAHGHMKGMGDGTLNKEKALEALGGDDHE
jgi:hypothetical protein